VNFRRGLLWTAAGQASLFAIQFGGAVIIARLLSPYETGVFALAMAVVGVINLIQSVGLGSYIVREPDLNKERIAAAFTVNAILSILLSAITAGVGFAGTYITANVGVRTVLIVLSLLPIIGIFSIIPYGMLERQGRFKAISVANIVSKVVTTFVTVAMAYCKFSYLSIAWGQISGALTSSILLLYIARNDTSLKISIKGWREISRFGIQMIAITGVNSLSSRASDFILGKLDGIVALGLYSRASNINGIFWENLHGVIGRVVFVELSRQVRAGLSLRSFYLKTSENITAILWPIFGGLAVLAAPLVHIVYGAKWDFAAVPFAILAVASLVLISVTMTWEIFVACGETARQAKMEFARSMLSLVMFGLGCTISMQAAACARVLDSVVSIIVYGPHLRRMTNTNIKDMMKIYFRSALLTVLAIAPSAVLVLYSGDQSRFIPFWKICIFVLSGVFLWIVGLICLKHLIWYEAKSYFSKHVTRKLQRTGNSPMG
jgi:O-antigen/teichoic acid export membrane protein